MIVVGGGITGLSVAHALESTLEGIDADVTLLEASEHLGGNILTEKRSGFVLDAGPDAWVATKPHATRLARELGLEKELIGTNPDTRKVYIAHAGRLHAMPEGLVLGVPTAVRPMVETELFSWDAKLRMGLDLVIPPRRFGPDDDESIADFVGRRLGEEVSDRLVGPLLSGIFAGDAEALSIRATFPQFVEAEAKYGSLIRAMRAQARERAAAAGGASVKPPSMFVSLAGGMADLPTTLAHKLRFATVETSSPVEVVERLPLGDARGPWLVQTPGADRFADAVALTAPLHVAARLVGAEDPSLGAALSDFHYASTATVFLGYRRRQVAHPLDGVGFIVPRSMQRPILASTWVSSKWSHRAPAQHVLLRVFLGGAHGEHVLDREDDDLLGLAESELDRLMGLSAPRVLGRVFRFPRRSPQPVVGHLGKVARVRRLLADRPGLFVAGNGFEGTGIPDCIKQAEAVAEEIRDLARADQHP